MRILRPHGLGLVLPGLVLVGLAGCGGARGVAADPGSAGTSPARYLGPLTAPVTYPGLGIALRPPANLAPALSWQQAYAACRRGDGMCQPDGSPTIVLADATLTGSSLTVHDPVYVVTYIDVPCVPTGPGPRPGSTPPPVTPTVCLQVSLIDANTGQFAYGASGTTP